MTDHQQPGVGALFVRGVRAGLTAQAASLLAQLGLLVLVLRAMPPAEFGRYALATASMGLTAVVAGLQLDQQVARDREGNLASYLRAAMAAAAAIVVVAVLFGLLSSPAMRPLYLLGAVVYGLGPFQRVLVGAAARDGAGRLATVGQWLPGVVRLSVVGALAVRLPLGAMVLVMADVGASVAVTAALLKWAASNGLTSRPGVHRPVRAIVAAALPLLTAAGAWIVISRVDVLMMSAFGVSAEALGGYQALLRMLDVAFALQAAFLLFFVPAVSRSPQSGGALFAVAAYPLAGIAIVVLAAILTGSLDGAVGVVMGAYSPTGALLAWVGTAGFVHIATGPSGLFLVARHRAKALAVGSVLGAASNVVLNVVLVPVHGPLGGAVATTLALGVLNTSYLWSASRDPGASAEVRRFLIWLLAATTSTVAGAVVVSRVAPILVIPGATLVVAALLGTSRGLRRSVVALREPLTPPESAAHA